jgi:hypothetical protein
MYEFITADELQQQQEQQELEKQRWAEKPSFIDYLATTTFGKWVQKQRIDITSPTDTNYNPREFQKELEQEYQRPLTPQEISVLENADSKEEALKYLEFIEATKKREENIEALGSKSLAIATDFIFDPLNFIPAVGELNAIRKAGKATKYISSAVEGATYGSVYQAMQNDAEFKQEDYIAPILLGASLGVGFEASRQGMTNLFKRTYGENYEEAFKSVNIPKKELNKRYKTTMFDDDFTIIQNSEVPEIKEFGKMLAPDLLNAEGDLLSAKATKQYLHSKVNNLLDEWERELTKAQRIMKEKTGKFYLKDELQPIIDDYYFHHFIKEDLEFQLSKTKSKTEKDLLKEQIENVNKVINDLERKYPFLPETNFVNLLSDYFAEFRRHYRDVGKRFPNKKYYMTTKWDFDYIREFGKERPNELNNMFYQAVWNSRMWDEYAEEIQKHPDFGKGVTILPKKEFVKQVVEQIIDTLVKSQIKRDILGSGSVLLRLKTQETKAGFEYPLKLRNLNKYYLKDFLQIDAYKIAQEYGTKASGVIAIRKALKNLKMKNPKLYDELKQIAKEKEWAIDEKLPEIINEYFIKNKIQVPKKDIMALHKAIRLILDRNYMIDNPDSWFYKGTKLLDKITTSIYGGAFGIHSLGDIVNAHFAGNLVRTGLMDLSWLKEIRDVVKMSKDPEIGAFLKELGAFAEMFGGAKAKNVTYRIRELTNPNETKIKSVTEQIENLIDKYNEIQFKITGMNFVTGVAQGVAYLKYLKDFEALAKGAEYKPEVLKIMGLTAEQAKHIGNLLKKFKTKIKGVETYDLGKFKEYVEQHLEKKYLEQELEKEKK